ncbi:SDR family NAD(P)-dependent oxidoreductase [Pseudonocardia sp. K10HN5]|uniref:SDR family NAD(P)-dependent oxidoreductase n=2 Tax=Pseudonocardia acidicola TaxID=2724939 RepID=A0ABX1S995_9PSEU|nr:SDR family NAD(P)-dependent oxidoreductase [Pseudonocardia acidicola]
MDLYVGESQRATNARDRRLLRDRRRGGPGGRRPRRPGGAAAGVFHVGPVAETGPQQWRDMFAVNVIGLLVVTRAALPHLRRGTAPAVVTISSMSGRRVPTAAGGVYSATKHAVHAIGDGLRLELRDERVRVTTIAPGFVRTAILDDWPDGPLRDRYSERMDSVGLDPDTVADAVVHVLGLPAGVAVAEYAGTAVCQ